MKYFQRILGLLLLAVIPGVVLVQSVGAQRFSGRVDDGQIVHGSVYSARDEVDIRGTVHGDIFCMGSNVQIDATVHGDVICAGRDITISGTINGDVRLAGQRVSIDAKVARSATVAAMDFSLDTVAVVGQDLTLTANTANIKGKIGRDLVTSGGGSLTLNSPIGRHVRADVTAVNLRGNAVIGGNLSYMSVRQADIARGAQVQGNIERREDTTNPWPGRLRLLATVLSGFLLLALLLSFLFPRILQKTSAAISRNPGRTILVGVAAGLLMPIIGVGLCVTMIGIPVGVVLFLVYLLGWLVGLPIAGHYLGQRLVGKRSSNPVVLSAVGTIALGLACVIPVLGLFVFLVASWLGLGSVLLQLKNYAGPVAKA